MRPISIVHFERCYLGAWVLGLLNTALGWSDRMRLVQVQQAQAIMGAAFVPIMLGGVVLGAAITLLLWFFAARKGYVGAKWVIVVFYALGLVFQVIALAQGTWPRGLPGVVAVAGFVLNTIAVWLLFRPDARSWLGEDADAPAPLA